MSLALGPQGELRHPCFYAKVQDRYGRIHLPVASSCNLACAYCRRDYDCPHESRPGVTSRLMAPAEALEHLERCLARLPFLAVVGIAGPGDPFSRPEPTLACLELVRRAHPELILCLSTNGLNLAPHVGDLVRLGVEFATLTINTVDPKVGGRLHRRVEHQGRVLRGEEAGGLLLERQLSALAGLKARGFTVKINTVVVPGINDAQVEAVARRVAGLGADLMNLIPLLPVEGTPLEGNPAPDHALMHHLRERAGRHVPQMRHCRRCRSDAVGLLADDHSAQFSALPRA